MCENESVHPLTSRREILAAALVGAIPDLAQAQFPGRSQPQGSYFGFRLEGCRFTGRDKDPFLPGRVFDQVASYLNSTLSGTSGMLSVETKRGAYQIHLGNQQVKQREAIDFTKTVTRGIARERYALGQTKAQLQGPATTDEIKASINKILMLQQRYAEIPYGMTVLAADNERNGLRFGSKTETEVWNSINRASGLPELKGPFRSADSFLQAIIDTPPTKRSDGTLYFSVAFNGHGAPGGDGMSLHSNGAAQLSNSLLTPNLIAAALEAHCRKHAQMYEEADKAGKSAYLVSSFFCCFSQDQSRNIISQSPDPEAKDFLSRMEGLQRKYWLRPIVYTVGETMRPGFYQPGQNAAIPVMGVRALASAAEKKNFKLTFGDVYGAIVAGKGAGGSNPSLFMSDIKKPNMIQVGQREKKEINFMEMTLVA